MQARRRAGLGGFADADPRLPVQPPFSNSCSRFTWPAFNPPDFLRHRQKVKRVTLIDRTASATDQPCDTKTSTCRSFVTISSGLCFFWGNP